MGSPVLGWGGEAERAVEWAERALRLSPFDPWNWFPCHGLALGHFSLSNIRTPPQPLAWQFNAIHDQRVLHASRGGIGKIGQARGSKERGSPRFGTAVFLQVQQALCRCGLRGHHNRGEPRPLSGVKRTSAGIESMSASDPKRT